MKRRAALILMLLGVVLAGGASLLVFGISRQASEATRATIPQVYVVMATRELPDQSQITPDALALRPFPADFAPPGAIASPDQAVGKFAVGPIFRDQVIVAGQISSIKRSPNLSDRVPAGKVVIWLPMPDLLATQGGFRPGDKMDILLSLPLSGDSKVGNSTQTTLQNVEVFTVGTDVPVNMAGVTAAGAGAASAAMQGQPEGARPEGGSGGRSSGSLPLGFLVDHQDAVIIKFIKDSGGTIDLALRSSEEERIVRTDAMTIDSIAERFRFRVPQVPATAQGQPAPPAQAQTRAPAAQVQGVRP